MKTKSQSTDSHHNEYLCHIIEILSELGMEVITPGENKVSFCRSNDDYFLTINDGGDGIRIISAPWFELEKDDIVFPLFQNITAQAENKNFGDSKIGYFMSNDESKVVVFNTLTIEGQITEIDSRKLGNAILGMSIIKEWIISHFWVEIKNLKSKL